MALNLGSIVASEFGVGRLAGSRPVPLHSVLSVHVQDAANREPGEGVAGCWFAERGLGHVVLCPEVPIDEVHRETNARA